MSQIRNDTAASVSRVPTPCPVCLRITEEPRCARCGATMWAGPWLGEPTAEHRRRFADDLAAARRRHDLAAAGRAATRTNCELAQLVSLIRGDDPTDEELAAARKPRPATATEPVWAALAPALSWLTEDPTQTRTLVLVDIDSEDVRVLNLQSDRWGAPHARGSVRRFEWAALLTKSPESEVEALFLLAGGIGRRYPDGYGLTDDAYTAIDAAATAGIRGQVQAHVLHRLPGWPVPDQLAHLFTRATRHCTHGPRLDDTFADAAATHTPLREDYRLVAVAVDRRGATKPVTIRIFGRGDTAGAAASVAVTAPHGARELVLAVVAGDERTPPARLPAVDVIRAPVGSAHVTVQFRLHGPGAVSPAEPAGGRSDADATRSWPNLLTGVPPVYTFPNDAMDIVFAVELGGDDATVDRRLALIAQVIETVARRHPNPAGVRAAVVGYRDHAVGRRRGKEDVRQPSPPVFGSLTDAGGTVRTLVATQPIAPYEAPLEDALAAAAQIRWRDPAVARRLLLVGSRPPHDGNDVTVCPNGYHADTELARLNKLNVQRLAIWDKPDWADNRAPRPTKVAEFWQQKLSNPGSTLELTAELTAESVITEARLLRPTKSHTALRFPIVNGRGTQENSR